MTHNTVVVDASVWVSMLMQQDVNHAPTAEWMNAFRDLGGAMVVPTLLLIEVSAAIARRTGQPSVAKRSANQLRAVNFIEIAPLNDRLVRESIRIAADLSLRASDAVYVALANRRNLPLVSWDNQQLQRGRSLVAGYTPGTFPF